MITALYITGCVLIYLLFGLLTLWVDGIFNICEKYDNIILFFLWLIFIFKIIYVLIYITMLNIC